MDLTDIKIKAEKFCHSYAEAVRSGVTNPSSTTAQLGERIFSHYQQEGFVSFAFGHKSVFGTKEVMLPSMESYMDRWVKYGLGVDIRMYKYRIEAVHPNNALCFITWSIHPPAGSNIQGWNWENVYSFRVPLGQDTGFWELVINDNETGNLLQRFPDFMAGMA